MIAVDVNTSYRRKEGASEGAPRIIRAAPTPNPRITYAVRLAMPIVKYRQTAAIDNLPPRFKWEVLRRHPHYIRDWRIANLDVQVPAGDPCRRDPEWPHVEAAVARMHMLTGFQMRQYPDPAKAGPGLPEGGAFAHTLSILELLQLVIWNLPPDAQREVGRILVGEGLPEPSSVARYVNAAGRDLSQENLKIQALTRLQETGLGMSLVGYLAVNLNAPLRGIVKEVSSIIKDEKKRRGIEEKRPRPDKIAEYLDVWDRREGWCGGKYDGRQEKPLRVVAAVVGRSPNTVNAQYKSAFSLIFGTEYTPLDWLCRMARHKWPYSKYKGWRTEKNPAEPTITPTEAVFDDHQAVEIRDLIDKAKELGRQGFTHGEIARRLQIKDDFKVNQAEAEQMVKHLLTKEIDL
jgi:hypothetical protein